MLASKGAQITTGSLASRTRTLPRNELALNQARQARPRVGKLTHVPRPGTVNRSGGAPARQIPGAASERSVGEVRRGAGRSQGVPDGLLGHGQRLLLAVAKGGYPGQLAAGDKERALVVGRQVDREGPGHRPVGGRHEQAVRKGWQPVAGVVRHNLAQEPHELAPHGCRRAWVAHLLASSAGRGG